MAAYRVTFRRRFNQDGDLGPEEPIQFLNVEDGVIEDCVFVERFRPEAEHGMGRMEEDDDFLAFGTEIWEFQIADGREDDFVGALGRSGQVIEYDEIDELELPTENLTDRG